MIGGRALMLEVKRPGKAGPTELQQRELQRWHDAGAVCAVVRHVDDVRGILARCFAPEVGAGARELARVGIAVGGWEAPWDGEGHPKGRP